MTKTPKINAAVLGLGGMGGTHVSALKASPYVDKIYGYEPDPGRRAQRARELGVIPMDLADIMRDPAIAMVDIASINEAHVPQAVMGLRAGKAVLCEKPMGTTMKEAEELIKVQQATGGFLQIGFELHYSKLYSMVKDWILAGAIGTPVNIQCRYYCCEFHRKDSWRSRSTGGFLIGEKLSHYLDLQRWWFSQPLESVYSLSSPKVVPYFSHRDNHQIMARFKGGGVATLNFIMYIAESYHEDPLQELLAKQSDDGHYLQYYVCGTKGAIETDVFRRRVRRWEFGESDTGFESKIVETHTFPKEEDQVWFHNTYGQNLRVIELIAKGLPPEVPAADAYETMKFCFAAEQSEDTGRVIAF
ncbi:MAG: Gfo/Idh/MocA family oxidoreductase [Kiritimatiellae bacterium]|nr:Gfo/Idh/MocA family oxidoreductase [Kiritimatiellia bacterium]